MKTFRIALYPGDGIGVDVIEQTVRVLEAVQARLGDFQLKWTSFPWGSHFHAQHGVVVPDDFLELLRPFDAILLGAVGDPAKLPDHITLAPLVQIRQRFDQYACVRPAKLFPGVRSPLASSKPIDMVVIRENSEGEYSVFGGRVKEGSSEEVAVQMAVHTRKGVERILRFGFEQAKNRRQRLTMITKSNALRYGMVLWDDVLEELRPEYPGIECDKQHADAAAMNFVRCPQDFDVVVASNLFGDLLTDLAGAIVGGLGLAPSANINPDRSFPSLFEPVHGSAPDIAGRGIANPAAAILSAAMMIEWLGLAKPGKLIRKAVDETLSAGDTTPDVGGTQSTVEMADAIVGRIRHMEETR